MSERVPAISRCIINILLEIVPFTFHGLFSAMGALLILAGLISNWVEKNSLSQINVEAIYFVGGGDPFILTGSIFISLGLVIYIIKSLMR